MIDEKLLSELKKISEREQRYLNGDLNLDHTIYMKDKTNRMYSKKLLKEGKLISLSRHARFWPCPEHTHDYVEVVYMCQGSTTHRINGELISLREGNLLFMNQNARQEVLAAGMDDIAVNFIILPEFFDTILPMMDAEDSPLKKFIVDCLRPHSSSTNYLLFNINDILLIQNLVENLIWSLLYESETDNRINQFTMGVLFLQIMSHTERLVQSNMEETTVVQALRYLEENYQNGSLQELAYTFHFSVSWLSREIKKKTGKNYTELLHEKRLSRACLLLKNTDLKIEDIAWQVGYENISYFYKLFQKEMGISPRHYRKTCGTIH